MDKLELIGHRDFPLTTDSFGFMQAAYAAFEQLGYLGGDNYVVSGCVITGGSVSAGYMFLKGQLMPFVGGSIQTNVKIVTVLNDVNVDAGIRKQISYRAEFGTSTNPDENVPWSSITHVKNIIELMAEDANLSSRISSNSSSISGVSSRVSVLESDSGLKAVTASRSEVDVAVGDVRQIGSLIILNIRFKITSALSGGFIELMKLPSVIDKPTERVWTQAVSSHAYSPSFMDIVGFNILETDGTLRANQVGDMVVGEQYTVNVSYFV